jgi:5-methylcytosine-specific restriction endonuclease McrA
MRKQQLARRPYCQCPHHRGQDREAAAMVVDHIEPHRGDRRLFWNTSNLQSMTKVCHDRFKQSQEKGGAGFLVGCDEDGWPLSEDHPWSA